MTDSIAAAQHLRPSAASWGQERRLQFIDFRLRWDGRLNRSDLTSFFHTSIPQASLDLAKYSEAAPGNLQYDPRSKSYVVGDAYQPLYRRSHAERFLHDLLAVSTGVVDRSFAFLGWEPPFDVAPQPARAVDDAVVHSLVVAIRDRRRARIAYQSISGDGPSSREISPHALAHNGSRWHVRAYCHMRKAFRDFVIGRIQSISVQDDSAADPGMDAAWHRVLDLVIAPLPELPIAAQRVLALDYGMVDGETVLKCRHALLYYTLQNLRLVTDDRSDVLGTQIYLKNRRDLQGYIDEVTPARS
jgi:hypothetical protein